MSKPVGYRNTEGWTAYDKAQESGRNSGKELRRQYDNLDEEPDEDEQKSDSQKLVDAQDMYGENY